MVSNLTKKLDPIVGEWASRPLNTIYYPYIYVDAMYIKVREHKRVVSKAVYTAIGVKWMLFLKRSELKKELLRHYRLA